LKTKYDNKKWEKNLKNKKKFKEKTTKYTKYFLKKIWSWKRSSKLSSSTPRKKNSRGKYLSKKGPKNTKNAWQGSIDKQQECTTKGWWKTPRG